MVFFVKINHFHPTSPHEAKFNLYFKDEKYFFRVNSAKFETFSAELVWPNPIFAELNFLAEVVWPNPILAELIFNLKKHAQKDDYEML